MKTYSKLMKYMLIMLVALIIMPSVAMGKKHNTQDEALQKALVESNIQAQKEICQIEGNDCQEVVDLLYEIFMVQDYEKGYITKDGEIMSCQRIEISAGPKVIILEPYATQLKQKNIQVTHYARWRDGGSTDVFLSDCTAIYFDNSISHYMSGGLKDPRVVLPDGREFSLKRPEEKNKTLLH